MASAHQRTLETAEAIESIATAEGEGMVRHATGRVACSAKVRADPDAHTRVDVLQERVRIVTPDGAFLRFDAKGNEHAVAALKSPRRKIISGLRSREITTATPSRLRHRKCDESRPMTACSSKGSFPGVSCPTPGLR